MKMEARHLVQNVENAVRMGLEEAGRKCSECEQEMEVSRRQVEIQNQVYLLHLAVQQLLDASQRKEQERHYLDSSYQQLARALQTFAPADDGTGLSFSNDSCIFGAELQFSSFLSEQSTATAEALSPQAAGVGVQLPGVLNAGASCHDQRFVAPSAGPALNYAALGVLPACVKTEAQQQQSRSFAGPGVDENRAKRRRGRNFKTTIPLQGVEIISLTSDESSDEEPILVGPPVSECMMLRSEEGPAQKQRRVAIARRFTQAGVGAEGFIVCEGKDASGRDDMGVVEVPTMEARASASQLPYLFEDKLRRMVATGGLAEEAAALLVHGIRQDIEVNGRSTVGGTISAGLEAVELAKQVEAAELAKQVKAAELAKQVKAAELAKQVEAAELAKQVEAAALAKQVEAAELAKQVEAAELAKQVEAAELAKQVEADELATQVKGNASGICVTQSPAKDSGAVLGDSAKTGLPGATSPVRRGKPHREGSSEFNSMQTHWLSINVSGMGGCWICFIFGS